MKKISLVLILAMGFVGAEKVSAQSSDVFSSPESSLDGFGFWGSRDKGGKSGGAVGYGAGFNYFFTQNFGVGADSYMDAFTVPYLLNANGIFRYPIENTCIAPYAFAGFGREWWHAPQWMGDIGGGIEYRPAGNTWPVGVFADIRGVFPTETKDYAVLRFGIRFILK